MKNILLRVFLSLLLLVSAVAGAGLYKGVDAEGNVVYSDKPFDNAKKFTPPAITVMDAPKVPAKEEPVAEEEAKPEETEYTALGIRFPRNQQTIWNEPNLTVRVNIKPDLDVQQGHSLWLIMDGKPLVKKSRSTSLPVGRVDRGEHKLQVQVRNKQNRILRRTKPVTVHIKQTSIPRRAPR